jgi:CBS domain-containing protein
MHFTDSAFDLLSSRVERLHIRPRTLKPDSTLFEVIDELDDTYAVLIVDGQKLMGILTTYDIMHFLREYFEDFMRIEDIEVTLRQYTEAVLPSEEARNKALIAALGRDKQDTSKPRKQMNMLTLGEQVQLMTHPDTWPRFDETLEPEQLFRALMVRVVAVRNQLAHFRGRATQIQDAMLRYVLDWLQARRRPPVTLSTKITATATIEAKLTTNKYTGKYGPLRAWLEDQPDTESSIRVPFSIIEELIGGSLPSTAFKHRSWWANDSVGHVQSKTWLQAGWRVVDVDISSAQEVTFVRATPIDKSTDSIDSSRVISAS